MDENWGYPYFRKPAFRYGKIICINRTHVVKGMEMEQTWRFRAGQNIDINGGCSSHGADYQRVLLGATKLEPP